MVLCAAASFTLPFLSFSLPLSSFRSQNPLQIASDAVFCRRDYGAGGGDSGELSGADSGGPGVG